MSTSTASPTSPPTLSTKPSLVHLNVRDVLEKECVEEAKEISRKVNLEIEKKKEELRMLVGERYRDLIDAADTICTMRTSSISVFDKLGSLREKFSSFPAQLVNVRMPSEFGNKDRLNPTELEIASELKLSLEIPRQLNVCLDKKQVVAALHLYLFYEKYLFKNNSKPFSWTFLTTNSGQSAQEISDSMKISILNTCKEEYEDFNGHVEKLAECFITKQVLTKTSCQEVLKEFLQARVKGIRTALEDGNTDFVNFIELCLKSVYSIFIDPQLYNYAAKSIRKPKILPQQFGFKFTAKSLEQFNQEVVNIEEPLRATLLAEIILKCFIHPLKEALGECYSKQIFLPENELKYFHDLNEYRTSVVNALKTSSETQDLARIVLGTSKTLWSEIFQPVFQEKCQKVGQNWIKGIFQFLDQDAFPRFQKLEDQLDLVSFVWKPPTLNVNEKSEKYDCELDLKLKLNCLSPHVAGLCAELEEHFLELLKDFQTLGDLPIRDYISISIVQELEAFLEKNISITKSLFVGKLCSAISELCTTLWKLLSQNDKAKLRQVLQSKCDTCWTSWCDEVIKTFVSNLEGKMCDLSPFTISSFMPVAEDFVTQSEGEEIVKPSIHVPVQLSHTLHTLMFGICVDFAKVGPQSIPKSVREQFRLTLGHKIQQLYEKLLEDPQSLIPQVAVQFIFDLKFSQWLHPTLTENNGFKSLLVKLQGQIDPFDLDIVIPRMQINLKRFLFETHLTLGLLFSEESHSFIAQNFKTKQNQSLSLVSQTLSTPLQLLPI